MGYVSKLPKQRIEYFIERMDKLKSKRKLYIDGCKEKVFDSPEDVISFMYDQDISGCTRYADNDSFQGTGSARSIGDLYRICSFYLPEVKIKEVIDAAQSANFFDDYMGYKVYLYPVYCGDVRKIVYHVDDDRSPQSYPSRRDFEEDIVFSEEFTLELLKELNL